MPRKGIAPKLHDSGIVPNGLIGRGQKYYTPSIVWRAELTERKSGKRFTAAAKSILEGTPNQIRHSFLNHQKAWRALRKAGLPVPKFSRVMLKKDHLYYLTAFMEDMEKKHGPLLDGHVGGYPMHLETLKVGKNSTLIKSLASDLATIHKLGFSTTHIDFWHFYTNKLGEEERIILDFNDFYKAKGPDEANIIARKNVRTMQEHLGKKEFFIFYKNYLRQMKK